MPVTFIIGRAGSGKTRHCFDSIVNTIRRDPLGPPIYWLLPRQATFSAERELTCLSGLNAFCRARVVSFEEFGRDVFDDCGGSAIPEVTSLGRQMILGHLLRRHRSELRFFSNVARQPGLAAELDATFAEFERSGQSVDGLGSLLDELSQSNASDMELAPLLDKLHDTRLLYVAYGNYLGQDRLDQHRRLTQVEASLSRCQFLKRSALYVDSFIDFTEYERRILVGAAKAGASLHISLLIDPNSAILANPHPLPDEMSLFRRTEETYRKLHFAMSEAGIAINDPVRLEQAPRFQSGMLRMLDRGLFHDPITPSAQTDGMELVEAPDRRAEVDAAARRVRSLMADGLRLRDIGVLVRGLEPYHRLIDSSFREHDIPYFVDRRRTAAHHPLLQFVRSVFHIARNDWPHDAVMSLLRGGLAGVCLFDADGLENYVLGHRIRGAAGWESPKPWGFRRRLVGAEEEAATVASNAQAAETTRWGFVDKLLPLIELLRENEPRPVHEIAAAIFGALDRFEVSQTIAGWVQESAAAGQLEESAEHEQVWINLVELFEQMVDLLGNERMTAAEFHDVLESGLDSFDLALTPPTVDQVLVGQVDRTRSSQLKAVLVLGLNEGQFPQVPTDGLILTDTDRRALRRRRIDLDPGLQQRVLDERLLGYIAFTRASQSLFVSRPLADEQGRPTEPSNFWRRLTDLFPQAKRTVVEAVHKASPQQIATPRQLVTSLMRWVRGNPDPVGNSTDDAWPALYQWLAEYSCNDDAIDRMRYHAWRALSYTNTAQLSAEMAAELFRSPLVARVSQLESFARCPFQHFARYTLGLRPQDRQEMTVQDLGRIYHDLLEAALKDVLRRREAGDRTITLESAIAHFVKKLGGSLRNELMLGSAKAGYVLDRTRHTLQQVALSQRELLRRGLFRPQHVGITFGPNGNLPALVLQTPGGAQVQLAGKIDRVDRIQSSPDAAVIDYRMGSSRLPLGMVMHGLSLQLLTYLLVLESNGKELGGSRIDPAAAFYQQLVRKLEDVKHPSEAGDPNDPAWRLKLKPRGVFDRRCLGALDRGLTNGASEVVQAYIKQDGSLGHRNTSDVVESQEFRNLLKLVATKLGELADGILSGKVDVTPYRLNDSSPCPHCEYRSVCRFEPAINRYNHLNPITRDQVMAKGESHG